MSINLLSEKSNLTLSKILSSRIYLLSSIILLSSHVTAQVAPPTPPLPLNYCQVERVVMDNVFNKYTGGDASKEIKNDAAVLQGKADDAKKSGGVGFEFNMSWKDEKIVLTVPEFKMVTQSYKFDVPQVTMNNDKMVSFDIIKVKFTHVYPEFYTDTVKFGIPYPEFKYDTTEIRFDLPEVSMKDQNIIMSLPQFTIVDVSGKVAEELRKEGEAVANKAQNIKINLSKDASPKVSDFFTCLRNAVNFERDAASKKYDVGIVMLQAGIKQVVDNGGDPSDIKSEGSSLNMTKQLSDLIAEKDKQLFVFKDVITRLDNSEKVIYDGMK